MARKFLYIVAFCIVVYMAGRLALTLFPEQITRAALVPGGRFEPQPPVAGNAYAADSLWISRPGMAGGDPARFLPQGAAQNANPLPAAVFFVHPTSYLERKHWNGPVDDRDAARIAAMMVRGMASAFNGSPDLWVPRYRQATLGAFLTDAPEARQALDLAYGDVARAFDRFVASTPADQPIVLAGHSQGAYHLRRLIKEKVAGTPLARRVVAVYAIGWPVSLEHDLPAMAMPACQTATQTRCVLSWLSYAEPANPAMTLSAYERSSGLDGKSLKGSAFICSNPLTGSLGGTAPAAVNLGTLVPDEKAHSAALKPGMVPARCGADGLLYIGPAPDLGPYVFPGNNFHVYDIPLFWANLRADVTRRVAAWKP
ncbi:MAG: DUF3089 domain-containing protein [Sphingomonadales bacterium]|nr:DUF3089 domain-containing protein [Sphingomonadales bacterium]